MVELPAHDSTTRVQRMLAGLLASENDDGKLVLVTSVFDPQDRRLHQAFTIRKWKDEYQGRQQVMLTVELANVREDAGERWARPVKVCHLNTSTGRWLDARSAPVDPLLRWSARKALEYARTGLLPESKNGRVEIIEEALCGMCGRKLRDPVSIERGIGPDCYKAATGSRTMAGR